MLTLRFSLARLVLLVMALVLPAAACSGAGQPPTETFRAPGSSVPRTPSL